MEGADPLTGEPAEEDAAGRRPYAVMLSDIEAALPQAGISRADVIYELPDAQGVTRMMALFMDISDVETVGNIRSARYASLSVARAYDAILVHAGGSEETLRMIEDIGFDDICSMTGKYAGDTFFLDPERVESGVQHSLFATGQGIADAAEELGYSRTHGEGYDGTFGLSFSRTASRQCTEDADTVTVRYAGGKTSEFTYQTDSGQYSMKQFGADYADSDETPVLFKNLLILKAETTRRDDGDPLSVELTGEGEGWFCCGGRYVPILWSRAGEDDSFRYTLEDGTPLSLGIGRTFVAVLPTGDYTGSAAFSAKGE